MLPRRSRASQSRYHAPSVTYPCLRDRGRNDYLVDFDFQLRCPFRFLLGDWHNQRIPADPHFHVAMDAVEKRIANPRQASTDSLDDLQSFAAMFVAVELFRRRGTPIDDLLSVHSRAFPIALRPQRMSGTSVRHWYHCIRRRPDFQAPWGSAFLARRCRPGICRFPRDLHHLYGMDLGNTSIDRPLPATNNW